MNVVNRVPLDQGLDELGALNHSVFATLVYELYLVGKLMLT